MKMILLVAMAALLVAVAGLSLSAPAPVQAQESTEPTPVLVRVWRDVNDHTNFYVTVRLEGRRWGQTLHVNGVVETEGIQVRMRDFHSGALVAVRTPWRTWPDSEAIVTDTLHSSGRYEYGERTLVLPPSWKPIDLSVPSWRISWPIEGPRTYSWQPSTYARIIIFDIPEGLSFARMSVDLVDGPPGSPTSLMAFHVTGSRDRIVIDPDTGEEWSRRASTDEVNELFDTFASSIQRIRAHSIDIDRAVEWPLWGGYTYSWNDSDPDIMFVVPWGLTITQITAPESPYHITLHIEGGDSQLVIDGATAREVSRVAATAEIGALLDKLMASVWRGR